MEEKLQQKIEELKNKIEKMEQKEKELLKQQKVKIRKEETRKKIIIGAEFLKQFGKDIEFDTAIWLMNEMKNKILYEINND